MKLAVLGVVSCLIGLGSTTEAQTQPIEPTLARRVLINEVLFNEAGSDAASGGEFIELVLTVNQDLSSYVLEDLGATWSVGFPSHTLSAGTRVLVFLGSYIPLDFNQSYPAARNIGHVAVAAGLSPGDYLSNTAGGVRLRQGTTTIDEVSWTVGGVPPGADPATCLDVSFPTRPVRPGDSIGRSWRSAHTGLASDWDRNGGVNSLLPTPGERNMVPLPDASGLELRAQQLVNQLAISLSLETLQPGWIEVTNAVVLSTAVNDDANWVEVQSTHEITIEVFGVPKILTGEIVARFDRVTTPGQVQYSLKVAGSVASPDGFGFDLDHSQTVSGFHTNTQSATCVNSYVWREYGQSYPFSITGSMFSTQTGVTSYLLADTRDCADWGGAGNKHSTATTATVETQDGTFLSSTSITRPMQMGPPPTSGAGSQTISGSATLNIESTCVSTPQANAVTFSRFDIYHNGTLNAALQAGMQGTQTQSITTDSSNVATYHLAVSLPMTRGGQSFTAGCELDATGAESNGKFVIQGVYRVLADGSPIATSSIFVDPPLQSGGEGRSFGGCMDAAASCAAVGASGGAVVGLVGGAVVGGVVGAGAGGAGALPGAKVGMEVGTLAGAAVGGAGGALVCGLAYLCGWWD